MAQSAPPAAYAVRVSASDYNYVHFELGDEDTADFENFPTHRRVGEAAPDATLLDAHSGEEIRLSTLWKRNHVLIEFGSLT